MWSSSYGETLVDGVTFSFLSICQCCRNCEFPALSCAHVPQPFIPTLHHLLDPKCEPYWMLISILAAANGYNDAIQLYNHNYDQNKFCNKKKLAKKKVLFTWNESASRYSLGSRRNAQEACLHTWTGENKRLVCAELLFSPPAQAIVSQWQKQRLGIASKKQTK